MDSQLARRTLVLAMLLGLALLSRDARADTRACAQAHVDAQRSMRAGTLRQARERLAACAREDCPAPIRKDCVGWGDEVSAAIPSIVVDAKGPDGTEVFDVRVSVGGEVVTAKLDSHPIELDPGTYTITLEREGSPAIEKEVVLRQGQKSRLLEVRFAQAFPSATAATKEEGRAEARSPSPLRRTSIGPWVLGAAGIALAGVGAYFWVDAERRFNDAEATCAPLCPADRVGDIDSARLLGDVLAIAGLAAVGGAAIWLLTASSSPKPPPASWSNVLVTF